MIDFRSDTVTKPTEEMKGLMFSAKVGDDVLGDDPTVIELEKLAANLFNHEAALFCPSGTMANQIAIKVHTNAPGEVICSDSSHIYKYEGGGIAFNSGISVRLINSDRGRFTLNQLKPEINPNDIHFPETQLVAIENTCNKGGGCYWNFDEIKSISEFCNATNIPLHLDGARLFNALIASGTSSQEMGAQFQSLSICLSKGLGAPVGSVLIGSKAFIHKARRIRKLLGGGMRQVGYLAAAGIYALNNNVNRLVEDHRRAKEIGKIVSKSKLIEKTFPIDTNIVIFKLLDSVNMDSLILKLKEHGILVVSMGPQLIRIVTHLHITNEDLIVFQKVFDSL